MDGALVFYSTHRQGAILKLFYMESASVSSLALFCLKKQINNTFTANFVYITQDHLPKHSTICF